MATFCLEPGSVSPTSTAELQLEHSGEVLLTEPLALDVRPFGYDMGRDVEPGAPEALSWFAHFTHAESPFFTPHDNSWYQYQITSPLLFARELLLFAGNEAWDPTLQKGSYALGAARLEDGEVVEVSAEPILPSTEGAWDSLSQNAPTVAYDGERYVLWYHGRASDDDYPVIGRAFSTDGMTWEPDPNNPLFGDPVTQRVAHPTVYIHDDLVELWYLADDGINLALSDDGGATFTPYCGGALGFIGKTPEIAWTGERYILTWVTGDAPNYHIRWSESFDGIRWLHADDYALEATDTDWENVGVANGQPLWEDGELSMVYVGVGESVGGRPGNGFGIATRP